MRTRKGDERPSVLPVVDFLTLVFALVGVLLTVLVAAVHLHVLPLEATVEDGFARLGAARQRVAALRSVLSEEEGVPPPAIPIATDQPSDGELLDRIAAFGTRARALFDGWETSDREEQGLWTVVLRSLVTAQRTFWKARAAELCVPAADRPALPPPPTVDAGADVLARDLAAVLAAGARVWAVYEECLGEKVEEIPDDLLHFAYNQATPDPAVMTPEDVHQAHALIRELVAQRGRGYRIIVRGHCSPEGPRRLNDLLSFARALYVVDLVRERLAEDHLVEGRDYVLVPEGLGVSVPPMPARAPSEDEAAYFARCRRIQLAFQRMPSDGHDGSRRAGASP